jgi:hypothetical protein
MVGLRLKTKEIERCGHEMKCALAMCQGKKQGGPQDALQGVWIDPGRFGSIGMIKLCGYAWPEEAKTESATRKREQRIREALEELRWLKWKIADTANGTFKIKCPKLKDLKN